MVILEAAARLLVVLEVLVLLAAASPFLHVLRTWADQREGRFVQRPSDCWLNYDAEGHDEVTR